MFVKGDHVRTRLMNSSGHTRLPSYLRGRPGRIDTVLGALPFADRRASGERDAFETTYTVRFAARDLWGPDADPSGDVCADLYESYLEPLE